MWIMRIALQLHGIDFSPAKMMQLIKDNAELFSYTEPRIDNGKNIWGTAEIIIPGRYGIQQEQEDYEAGYIVFIEKNYSLFQQNGVTEMNLFVEVFNDGGQCNFEIFSRDTLKRIANFNIAIPISYYHVSTESITDILKEIKMPEEKLRAFIEFG